VCVGRASTADSVVLSLQRKKRTSLDSETCYASFAQRTVRADRGGEVRMHPNEKLLRDADEAQIRGDVEPFGGVYTDDIFVHIPGKSYSPGCIRARISP